MVPGVTAAVAAGAYAGFSLTHREQASAVAFITGHEDPDEARYRGRLPGSGPLSRFAGILHGSQSSCRNLPAPDRCRQVAETPAAVVSRATTPRQRTVCATLGEHRRTSPEAPVARPVTDHRRRVRAAAGNDCVVRTTAAVWPDDWRRRAAAQCVELIPRIIELGAEPVLMPTIEILPPEDWSRWTA